MRRIADGARRTSIYPEHARPPSLVRRRAEAGDRARTGDIQLGRLALYQLSYTRAQLA